MRPQRIHPDQIIALLKINTIMTVDEVAEQLKCSRNTVFRKLSSIPIITSYTHTRRYIAISHEDIFDEFGIWGYQEVYFSKYGGVKETITEIITRNKTGLTSGQINDILHTRVNMQLGELVKTGRIYRLREGRNQVYLGGQDVIRKAQIQQRQATQKKVILESIPSYISKRDLFELLVIIVEHHLIDRIQIESYLRKTDKKVSSRTIDWLMSYFEIEKKGLP